jgi:hypothetical protein
MGYIVNHPGRDGDKDRTIRTRKTMSLDGDVDLHAGSVVAGLVAADFVGAGLVEGVGQLTGDAWLERDRGVVGGARHAAISAISFSCFIWASASPMKASWAILPALVYRKSIVSPARRVSVVWSYLMSSIAMSTVLDPGDAAVASLVAVGTDSVEPPHAVTTVASTPAAAIKTKWRTGWAMGEPSGGCRSARLRRRTGTVTLECADQMEVGRRWSGFAGSTGEWMSQSS